MEFVAGPRSGMHEASLAQSIGDDPGTSINRPYLQPPEIDLFIQTILEWPDVRTLPRVLGIPLIVLFLFFSCSFMGLTFPFLILGILNKKKPISTFRTVDYLSKVFGATGRT
jgi:hypothetical protein